MVEDKKKHNLPDKAEGFDDPRYILKRERLPRRPEEWVQRLVGARLPLVSRLGQRAILSWGGAFVFVNMQLDLDYGAKGPAGGVGIRCGDVEAEEDGDFKVHGAGGFGIVSRLTLFVGAQIARWLENPPVLTSKHGLVEHHALVHVLPIHGYHLDPATPKGGRVWVRRVYADASGVRTHKEALVVAEKVTFMASVRL